LPPSSASRPSGSRPAFDAIILGTNSGKYDIGISSFTINAERMTQVDDGLSYFKAGTQWVTQKGNPEEASTRTTPVA
jgi:polar amino acid transport system substrate-binding protein